MPSRETSTFIQVPLSTAILTSRVATPGGALTFHFSGLSLLAASAAGAGGGAVCARAEPDINNKAASAVSRRSIPNTPYSAIL